MNKVELNKMVVDTALGNLKDKLHHIIDGIASAKAFDQYNAKCGEVDRLREALIAIMPYTATQCVGCHGDKCRESWCYSCNGEEEANEAAKAGQEAYNLACAALQHNDAISIIPKG